MRYRNPNRIADRIVFLVCAVIALVLIGYEAGAYLERRSKDAACVALPPIRQDLQNMTKKQQRLWIKYYLSRGGTA